MIGLTIAKLLKADTALMTLVPSTSIFPLVVNEDIPLPWIAYRIDSVEPEYTKDGWANDVDSFSIASFSNDYANLQLITKAVRKALEMKEDTGTGRITMTGYKEESDGLIFGTQLEFSVDITSY
jgi:hypothetical protein